MATFYGPWVATNDFRAVLEATVSNTSSTQCTVKLVLKIQSNYAYAGSSGRASVTCGSTTRSDSVSYDAGRTTTLMTESFTVARGSAKKSVSVSGKVWQLNYTSEYRRGSTASGSVTIPAIPYDEPSAPSSCSASRSSDTRAKITWTNGSTSTTKPRSSTKVERQTDGGSWAQVTSVGSSVTSYTDNTISANHRYRYRVRAYGSGGYSAYSTSGYIYTTPAAPRSVSAAVTGAGTSVRITVDGSNATWASAWEVQASLNGGTWTEVGSYASFPVTAEVGGGTVRLRARAVRDPLASAWTESATITTITPPLAPTVTLTPSGVAPTDSSITVSWVPNHPDGSDQTQAQVEYTVGSGAAQTATVIGAATTYQLPSTAAESPTTVSVRVRTHGADKEWGAWSGPVALTVAEPPSVVITSPGADGTVVEDLPLEVAWIASDSTGIAAQTITLYDASGRVLHSAHLDGAARSYTLDASTYLLSNLSDYVLRVTVTGGSTLQAVAERDFSTAWAEPAVPVATVAVDTDRLSTSVSVGAGENPSMRGTVPDAGIVRIGFQTEEDYAALLTQLRALPQGTYRAVARFELTSAPSGPSPMHGIGWTETNVSNPSDWIVPWAAWSSSEVGTVDEVEVEFDVPASAGKPVQLHIFGAASNYTTPDGAATVSLDVYPVDVEGAAPGVLPATSTLSVARVNADGSLWTVGDGLSDGETVVDPLPPLNTPVDYVITAHTAAGATSELRVTETLQALMGAFNFGPAAGVCELARLDPDWSHDVARSGTLYHFADGGEGGGLPVAYGGQDVDATRSMGFTLLDFDRLRRMQELARTYYVCWYRDPYGGRALCSVSWSFSSGIPYGKLDVSASMTETVFEEAW